MQYDLLKDVIAELAESLPGARIGKIHQPAADVFIFRLWNGRENLRLMVSVNPKGSRIHLTTEDYPNPASPPRFCQLLRSRLSRINSIELMNDDRIVALYCSGPKGDATVVAELTGRSSNLLLLNSSGIIIDTLRRHPHDSGQRKLAPGERYRFPQKTSSHAEILGEKIEQPGEGSLNAAVDSYYVNNGLADSATDLLSLLKKAVSKKRKQLLRRLEKIEKEKAVQSEPERFKFQGELLLANMHQMHRGMAEIEVLDYYKDPPEQVEIPLDAKLSPQDNVDRYFKRYKKAKRGFEHSLRRQQETSEELDWLETIAYQLTDGPSAADLEELASECRQNGLLTNSDRYTKKAQKPVAGFLEAYTPGGLKVLCGRNNRQNDELTSKILKAGDLWLHAQGCPGAHVVLKGGGPLSEVVEAELVFAAEIAAGHSKFRESTKVEVMVAEPKQVHKPKGAKPGLVTVREHRSLLVRPRRIGGSGF